MLGLTSEKRVEELESQLRELETHLRHAEIAADGLEWQVSKLTADLTQEKSRFKALQKEACSLKNSANQGDLQIKALKLRIAKLNPPANAQ